MRTTVNLSDDILERAKKRAIRLGKSLSELIELSLQRELDSNRPVVNKPFKLVTTRGAGLQPGFTWESLSSQVEELDRNS